MGINHGTLVVHERSDFVCLECGEEFKCKFRSERKHRNVCIMCHTEAKQKREAYSKNVASKPKYFGFREGGPMCEA